jgi:hypothetical protein
MYETKIQLSKEEMELAANPLWILTKNVVIEKVYGLFGVVAAAMQSQIKTFNFLPEEIIMSSPKISRGENYEGLPYVILDYPRVFGRQHIFAIRSMFWWGNFFSCTLHVRGKYCGPVTKNLAEINDDDLLFCINDSEWRHDMRTDNYAVYNILNKHVTEKHVSERGFIKLAKQLPVTSWSSAADFLTATAYSFISLQKS